MLEKKSVHMKLLRNIGNISPVQEITLEVHRERDTFQ